MTNEASGANINITESVDNSQKSNIETSEGMTDVCFDISSDGTVVISKPVAGVDQPISVNEAQSYVFNVDPASIVLAEMAGNNLVVTFDNGSSVTLENYSAFASNGSEASLTFTNGRVFSLAEIVDSQEILSPSEELLEEPQSELREEVAQTDSDEGTQSGDSDSGAIQLSQNQIDESAEEVAQIEPAAGDDVAQQLANIEPASGDAGGSAGNSGFGFGSSFDAQGVIPVNAVGPIDPTQLQYDLPEFGDRLLPEEEEPEVDQLVPLNPELEVTPAALLEDAPGGPVAVSLTAIPESAGSTLTITIGGIPSTWTVSGPGTYDPTTGEWTITTTPGTTFTGGPSLVPPADSDVDLTDLPVTVTEINTATGQTGTATSTIDVIVDAVADTPDVDANNSVGNEGDTLAMDIPTALTGEEVNNGGIGTDDGSESIESIIISPAGFNLADFTVTNINGPVTPDASGNIVFTDRSELNGLQITPNDPNFVGTVTFGVELNTRDNPTDTDFDTTNNTAQDVTEFTVTWRPEANPPEVLVNGGVPDAQVLEDNSVVVDVTGTLDPAGSGNEILSLTLTGVDLTRLEGGIAGFSASNGPDGEVWTRVPGSPDNDASFTITLNNGGDNYVGTFTFDPADDSDLDITGMVVTATAFEPATSTTASSGPDDFNVIVDAVADRPDVEALDDSGNEGTTLDIDITTVLTGEEVNNGVGGDDGSESVANIVLSPVGGVDLNDFTISIGGTPQTLTGGNVVIPAGTDLSDITITPNDSSFTGSIQLDVTLNTQENPNDAEFNSTNDTNSDVDTITLTWIPVVKPPVVKVNNGVDDAQVLEDGTVDVPVQVVFGAGTPPTTELTVTVTGIDLTKLDGFVADGFGGESWTRVAGSPDNDASFTITLPAGTEFNPANDPSIGFTFTPSADSDLDLTNMVVTATATDPVSNTSEDSNPDDFNVIVDAVADPVDIDAADDSGNEGETLDIVITNTLTGEALNALQPGAGPDDGSETVTNIIIAPLGGVDLSGFTIVNGNGPVTLDSNGNIVFTDVAELNGLQITPNDPNYSGSIDLEVTFNTRDNANDTDFNTTNDTAQDIETLTLTWRPVIDPPTIKVGGGADGVWIKEDGTESFDVVASLDTNAAPTEVLSITVSGINLDNVASYTLEAGPNGEVWTRTPGSPDNNATFTITLNAGSNYDGEFTFTPNPDSDLDIGDLTFTATATDSSVTPAISASANDDFFVNVDAVADPVDITAIGGSAEEGTPIAIDIDGFPSTDTDGSEAITGYEVRGDATEMAGFTFTVNGTERAPVNGVVTLTVAEVDALVITPKDSAFVGNLNLTAHVFNTDTPNDDEDDTGDNTSTDSTSFKVAWTDDDEPQITVRDVTVDESDLSGVPASTVGGNFIIVDFGDDSAGATITGKDNGFGNPQNITSNGNTIDVSFDAGTNTYTGTAGGEDVFTLTINPPAIGSTGNAFSSYTFTLLGTVDHPIAGDNSAGEHNDSIPFTFAFDATDSDGDVREGAITVNVLDDGLTANDDMVEFDQDDISTSGNVITGAGNTSPGGADDLSRDDVDTSLPIQNAVTEVNGVAIDQTPGATTSVDGTFGTLEIAADGSYTYTLDPLFGSGGSASLNPDPATLNGVDSDTYTNNGITVTGTNSSDNDLTYLTVDGGGIGLAGGSDKVWPAGEKLEVSFAAAQTVTFTIADIGSNNLDDGIDFTLHFTDGTTQDVEFDIGSTTVVDKKITVTFDSADYGGKFFDQVDVTSIQNSNLGKASFLLNDVEVTYPGVDCTHDVFEYTLVDGDGDTSTAILDIKGKNDDEPLDVKTEKLVVDETDIDGENPVGEDTDSGTVTANFGADAPGTFEIGNPNNVTVTGATNTTLTSNGVAVIIAAVGNKYVGYTTDVNDPVFELEIQSDGNYAFTLKGQLDHADTSDPDDTITLGFEVVARDSDNDTATGTIQVNVKDDGPVANDDFNVFDFAAGSADGNVITGQNGGAGASDSLSEDAANTVTQVAFGTTIQDVPAGGSTTIDGANGSLEIFSNGEYVYTPISTTTTTYSYSIDNPPGSDRAGDIKNVETSFVQETSTLSFAVTVEDSANGFTVAVNNGPNPKGEDGLTLFYFDNSGSEPVVTAYAYNGLNTQTSWIDGPGTDPVQQFVSSINDPSAFDSIIATDNGDGTVSYSFALDTSGFNASFDDSIGIWLHPVSDLNTSYDSNGYLTQWDIESQSYYDVSNKDTEIKVETSDCAHDQFTYTLTDADGDTSTATLHLECFASKLIVGQNVDDTGSTGPDHVVGGESGAILGAAGNDILIGDAGGSQVLPQTQNYNVLFVLDVSGSMGDNTNPSSRISILADAVTNLLNDFNDYQSGEVKVHFSTFSSLAGTTGTFSVKDAGELADAIAFLESLDGDSTTNYEAGLQSGIEWLQSGDPLSDAETITYFISDGAPNRYLEGTTLARIDSDQQYFDEVTGVDGSDEIGTIQTLSDQVISVGININGSNNEAKLDVIASNGQALLIDDANDLDSLLQETSPITRLDSAGDDDIQGGDSGDLIFGDVVNTDDLADDQGLSTDDGAGWEVFERLENGEGSNAGWSREDTVNYINNNAEELAAETTNAQGGREGGNDTIHGGAGDDTIFGQEGNDVIAGGAGDDTLYGGSGEDTFLFESVNDGTDTIKDFEVGEDVLDFDGLIAGYNSLQDAINDFVFNAQEENGNTVISVDADGQGGSADAVPLVVLEGVTGVTIEDVAKSDSNVV